MEQSRVQWQWPVHLQRAIDSIGVVKTGHSDVNTNTAMSRADAGSRTAIAAKAAAIFALRDVVHAADSAKPNTATRWTVREDFSLHGQRQCFTSMVLVC